MLARKLADSAVWNNVYKRYRVYLHTETTRRSAIGLSRVGFSILIVDAFVKRKRLKRKFIEFTDVSFLATVDRSIAQRCGNGIFLKHSGKGKKRKGRKKEGSEKGREEEMKEMERKIKGRE